LWIPSAAENLVLQFMFQQTANITFSANGAAQDILHLGDEGFASIFQSGSDAPMIDHETANHIFALCYMSTDVTFSSYAHYRIPSAYRSVYGLKQLSFAMQSKVTWWFF
jgi:hypothetical protein